MATDPDTPRVAVVGSYNHGLSMAVDALPAPGETVLGGHFPGGVGGQGAWTHADGKLKQLRRDRLTGGIRSAPQRCHRRRLQRLPQARLATPASGRRQGLSIQGAPVIDGPDPVPAGRLRVDQCLKAVRHHACGKRGGQVLESIDYLAIAEGLVKAGAQENGDGLVVLSLRHI